MNYDKIHGFSFVELLVSVSLFLIIVSVILTTFFTTQNVSKEAQQTRSIMDNLDFVMKDIRQNARLGFSYQCGQAGNFTPSSSNIPTECEGGTYFSFTPYNGDDDDSTDQIVYMLSDAGGRGVIEKSIDGGSNFQPLTHEMIDVTDMSFTVVGPSVDDEKQATVFYTIEAEEISSQDNNPKPLRLQGTISQRPTDL